MDALEILFIIIIINNNFEPVGPPKVTVCGWRDDKFLEPTNVTTVKRVHHC